MSEHAWTLDNLAAYVAGGLDADERERLTRHADECADCGRAVADARGADRQLMTLFASVRPSATLEDRLIRMLRAPRQSKRRTVSRTWIKVSLAVAAVALLAVLGAGVTALIDYDPMAGPGNVNGEAGGSDRSLFGSVHHGTTHHGANVDKEEENGFSRHATTYYHLFGGADKAAESRAWLTNGKYHELAPSPDELSEEILRRSNSSIHFELQTKNEKGPVDTSKSIQEPDTGKSNNDPSVPKPASPGTPGGGMMGMGGMGGGIGGLGGGLGGFGGGGFNGRFSSGWQDPNINRKMAGMDAPRDEGRPPEQQQHQKEPQVAQSITDQYFSPYLNITGRNGQEGSVQPTSAAPQKADKQGQQVEQPPPIAIPTPLPGGDKKLNQPPPPPEQPRPSQRYIIRSGDMEFDVDSFDAASGVVRKLVTATKGAMVTTENKEKLVNGKMRGIMVVRMPPEHLDSFVLDLRQQLGKTAELKGQKIGSEDVSKTYVDLESGLKSARTMQERFLKMIKEGKGEIKDLVAAEQALGTWNTKVEEIEGQLRYYRDRISLSTLTLTLTEKEIRIAAAVRESERVQAGVEVEDVEKAMREVIKAVDDAKGRVTRSEMRQFAGGQYNAVLEFDVKPVAAGPVRDRLNQLGTFTRLEIDRLQTPEGGDKLPQDGRLERGNTRFIVSLYNLANITPQETVVLRLVAVDVAEAYRTVRAAIVKAKGRIMGAEFDQKSTQQIVASLRFAVPRDGEGAVRTAVREAGEVLTRSVNRVATPLAAPDNGQAQLVTDKKVEYRLELVPATSIEPREMVAVSVEVADVEQTLDVLTAQAKELKGRIVEGPKSAHELNGRVTAFVVYEVPLAAEPALMEKVRNSGQVRTKVVSPNPQAPEGKLAVAHFGVTLVNGQVLVSRDEGLWPQVRDGLAFSLRGLSVSVKVLIVGLLFVLPWVVLLAGVWWLVRRMWGRPAVVSVVPAAPPTPSAPPTGTA